MFSIGIQTGPIFFNWREPEGGLWKISTFDGKKRQLLDDKEGLVTAAVSPDGSHIAFVKESAINEIWMIGPQDETSKQVQVKESKLGVSIASIPGHRLRAHIFSWRRLDVRGDNQGAISTFDLETGLESAIYTDRKLISQAGVTPVSLVIGWSAFLSIAGTSSKSAVYKPLDA